MLLIIKPETVLRWHRQGFRLLWKQTSYARSREPKVLADTITVIKEMVANNRFSVTALLRKQFVIVYSAAYDRRILDQTCARYNLPAVRPAAWHCAMLQYAKFSGVWNTAKRDYKWHKLQSGDHSALGDCRATLDTLRWMAEAEGSAPMQGDLDDRSTR